MWWLKCYKTIIEIVSFDFLGKSLQEKVSRLSQRLYSAHNDYVLQLRNAAEYERDYRTALLPALLEYQETVQAECISLW